VRELPSIFDRVNIPNAGPVTFTTNHDPPRPLVSPPSAIHLHCDACRLRDAPGWLFTH
jgi:hypothetical protein